MNEMNTMIFFGMKMTTRMKDSERMKLIAEFIKTGISPDGYVITENDNGKYRVRKTKTQHEMLQDKKQRLLQKIKEIDEQLNNMNTNESSVAGINAIVAGTSSNNNNDNKMSSDNDNTNDSN